MTLSETLRRIFLKLLSINGRATRLEFFLCYLLLGIYTMAITIHFARNNFSSNAIWFFIPIPIIGSCVGIRRAHDLGYSAWEYFSVIARFKKVGFSCLSLRSQLLFSQGEDFTNEYGDPIHISPQKRVDVDYRPNDDFPDVWNG